MEFGLCSPVQALGIGNIGAVTVSQKLPLAEGIQRHTPKQTSGKDKPEAKTAQFEDSRGQRKLLGGL